MQTFLGLFFWGSGGHNTTPDSCYATWSSLACQDHLDATQLDLHLHVKIILMLRDGWGDLLILQCFMGVANHLFSYRKKKENKNPWSTHRLLLSWNSGCSESTLRWALAKSDTRSCPRPWKSDKPNDDSQFDDGSRLMTHKRPAKFTKRSSLSLLFWTWKNGHLSKINGNVHSKRCCDGWKKQRRSVRRIPCSLCLKIHPDEELQSVVISDEVSGIFAL